jgi:hypothetical protein
MLLLSAIVLGVVFSLITGGRIERLSDLHLRYWALLLCALFVQVLLFSTALASAPFVIQYGGILYTLTLLAALAVILLNSNIRGAKLLALGTALNTLVIVANGGQMPVDISQLRQAVGVQPAVEYRESFINTAPMTAETRLPFLGDILLTPDWLPIRNVLSVGDMAIAGGVIVLLFAAMRPGPRREHGITEDHPLPTASGISGE